MQLCGVARRAAVSSQYTFSKLTTPAPRQKFKLQQRKKLHCIIVDSDKQATADWDEGKENMQLN